MIAYQVDAPMSDYPMTDARVCEECLPSVGCSGRPVITDPELGATLPQHYCAACNLLLGPEVAR